MKDYLITCKFCKSPFPTKDKRRKFCSSSCSAKFNNQNRDNWPDGWKQKIGDGVKKYFDEHPEKRSSGSEHSIKVGLSTKGKYKEDIKSILDVSKRTASKILKRLNIGCCICGWKEASCDIHHINGKKIDDFNGHWNLTLLCPNHHRMFHNHKLKKEDFIPLSNYFPENWRDVYYG